MNIHYPNESYLPDLKTALLRDTAGLPFYEDGPESDYTGAPVAFAVNISLLHREGYTHEVGAPFTPLPTDEVLLGQRQPHTHGTALKWSGISGYIGHRYYPWPNYRHVDEVFDPITHTIDAELREELGLKYVDSIDFRIGRLATEERTQFEGSIIHVVTAVGILTTPDKPEIILNKKELRDSRWLQLGNAVDLRGILAKNYLDTTLPDALAATGTEMNYRGAIRMLLSGDSLARL